jgi:hypothetical protein
MYCTSKYARTLEYQRPRTKLGWERSFDGHVQLQVLLRCGINSHPQYSHYNSAGSHTGAGAGQSGGRNPNGGKTVCGQKLAHNEHLSGVQELLARLRQKLLSTIKATDQDVATKDETMKRTRRDSDEKIKQAEEAAAKVCFF